MNGCRMRKDRRLLVVVIWLAFLLAVSLLFFASSNKLYEKSAMACRYFLQTEEIQYNGRSKTICGRLLQ